MITRSQSKAKSSEELHDDTDNFTRIRRPQSKINSLKELVDTNDSIRITRSKSKAKELIDTNNSTRIRRSQSKANSLKELIGTNDSIRITRSKSKAKSSEELIDTNNSTRIRRSQSKVNRELSSQSSKKLIETNNSIRITRSKNNIKESEEFLNDANNSTTIIQPENKAKGSEELHSDNNNSTIPQNVQDNVTTKTKKRIRELACKYPGCSAIYDRPFRLKRHIRSHTGERPYKCDNSGCDKCYIASSHLKRHADTHNCVKKGLQCNQCSLIVSNYHNLTRHYKRVHTNPLRCKECYAQFKKKHHLALHMNEHLGITTYKCSQCSKTFVNMRRLKRHEGFHEGKAYRCPIPECSEVFDKWSLLRKHKIQHNVHKCDICGKEYKRGATLRIHSKTHTENTFLPCPYDTCKRKYKTKSSLTDHIKIRHLNQKFVCDICKKKFTAKHSLRNHILGIHMGVEVRKRKTKKSERKRRKDAGIPKKSMVTVLTGLKFVHHTDKELLQRESFIELTA